MQEGENALVLALPIPPCVPAQASKGMTRSLSSMQEWQRQRDRKLEERRVAKEAAEAMSVRAAPVILKRSEAMVEAARRRQAQAQAQASRWVHSGGAPLSVVVLCTWRVGTPKPSTTTIVAFGMYIAGCYCVRGREADVCMAVCHTTIKIPTTTSQRPWQDPIPLSLSLFLSLFLGFFIYWCLWCRVVSWFVCVLHDCSLQR